MRISHSKSISAITKVIRENQKVQTHLTLIFFSKLSTIVKATINNNAPFPRHGACVQLSSHVFHSEKKSLLVALRYSTKMLNLRAAEDVNGLICMHAMLMTDQHLFRKGPCHNRSVQYVCLSLPRCFLLCRCRCWCVFVCEVFS